MKNYMSKFKKDIKKPDIFAVLRRINLNMDGKITFREFAEGLTPEYPGMPNPP